jgi:drug/metabolite transporter (DMT)-like permease
MHRRWVQVAILAFGVLCGSTAVIMIKASDENPYLLAAYRLLIATVFMLPFFLREKNSYALPYGIRQIRWSIFPGLLLGLHFITWNMGIALTPVANASLIVNTTPAVMPFFLWISFRERINRIEVLGTLLALTGLLVLGFARFDVSDPSFRGHSLTFLSMLFLAAYLALGRKNSGRLPLWLYMWPLYLSAGLFCLLCALPFVNPIKSYSLTNILLFFGLAIIPTFGGHTILNFSMKNFRGQVVSVANLGQIIFSALMGYFIFREIPSPLFYLTAIFILAGVIIILLHGYRQR